MDIVGILVTALDKAGGITSMCEFADVLTCKMWMMMRVADVGVRQHS